MPRRFMSTCDDAPPPQPRLLERLRLQVGRANTRPEGRLPRRRRACGVVPVPRGAGASAGGGGRRLEINSLL